MAIDIPDPRLIHPYDLDQWGNRVFHTVQTDNQRQAFQNFRESCVRFMNRRAEAHLVAMQFHSAEVLGRTTNDVQNEYFYRIEIFFHGYYSCLSQLANIVHRHPACFGQISSSSNRRFIEGVCALDEGLTETAAVLEEARHHRAFLDHPVSNRVSNWFTTATGDERILQIVFFGDAGVDGQIPDYAVEPGLQPVQADWFKFTPSVYDVEHHLKRLTNFVVDQLALCQPGPTLKGKDETPTSTWPSDRA